MYFPHRPNGVRHQPRVTRLTISYSTSVLRVADCKATPKTHEIHSRSSYADLFSQEVPDEVKGLVGGSVVKEVRTKIIVPRILGYPTTRYINPGIE